MSVKQFHRRLMLPIRLDMKEGKLLVGFAIPALSRCW